MEEKKKKKTNVFLKILKIIFFVIATIVVVIAGIVMYKANKYPDKVPDIFGYKPMIVLSGSMESSIYTGDLVFVKEVDPDTLKINDVIAFRNEKDTVTTHRIVEIIRDDDGKYFRTKGDANNANDANLVFEDDVEGVYVTRLAGVGNILLFMQQPVGLAVILLVILVVGLVWLYFINRKESKQNSLSDKERQEFEEFKKMKELENKQLAQLNVQDTNTISQQSTAESNNVEK